jgi:hypothetical protein
MDKGLLDVDTTSKQDSNRLGWGSFHRMEEFDDAVEINQEWRGSV